MESIDVNKNYKTFRKYIETYIHRDGVDRFLKWLDNSDAMVCPASTKYHLSCEGGLVQHSLNVFLRMIKMCDMEYGEECPYSKETIAFVSLLHDVSKINFYEKSTRNVKNPENGVWYQVPFYQVKQESDRLTFGGHEENSLYILSKFFHIDYEEELAIRWHSGAYASSDMWASNTMIAAFEKSPLALLLHVSDLMSMCRDESDIVPYYTKKQEKAKNDTNTESSDKSVNRGAPPEEDITEEELKEINKCLKDSEIIGDFSDGERTTESVRTATDAPF